MRVISKRTLREYCARKALKNDFREAIYAWYEWAEMADWASPQSVKHADATASILIKSRVVFNVKGNQLRIVVKINYAARIVYIRFVGTHAEYDKINAAEV